MEPELGHRNCRLSVTRSLGVVDAPGRENRPYQMDVMERFFVALTVVGSLGVIAVVIWMMMH